MSSNTPAVAQPSLPGVKQATAIYSQQDLVMVEQIIHWLDQHNKSRAWLGKKASIPGGTLSQILSGKYVSSPSKQLHQMVAALEVESARLADGTPGYIKGSVHKLMTVVLDRTRKHRGIGVFTGHVGIGKTRTLKEYRDTHPMTLLLEVSPGITPGVMMTRLLHALNAPIPPGLDRKFEDLLRLLTGSNFLIAADEAERMSPSALEYLRRLRDMAGVGVVLVGTEKLTSLIKPQHGQFDQIRSRVSMWPPTVQRISRDDADDMARTALQEQTGELPDEVLEALWAYAEGSARVLNENLIPALRDYGLGQLPLTATLVEKIAAKVLFMNKPGGKDGDK